MVTRTSYGSITDLHERMDGDNGELVYLMERSEALIRERYDAIKAPKSIIAAYGQGSKHVLVLLVGGIVKRVKKKVNKIQE